MNIYFAGIGGVGIGPLAEIALDAGYSIQGSDMHQSTLTDALQERGVAISFLQDGEFLESTHNETPIDLFVHTSALPASHPELLLAKQLGIKTAKRDELLARIIQEKNLKLIAVAGTHGKTTTTSMLIWAFKELGIPISYSVGTTLRFGQSGVFDPSSEYFVYECDEFDRNFLHFSPHLSLITSFDYDHPDTYPTPEDYTSAFKEFIEKSHHTILWKADNSELGATAENAWVLGANEVLPLHIAGAHNRRNATLVAKALEYLRLGSAEQTPTILDAFPGSARRFERLAENLYSDYGHHPVEIAATLQLARELSDHVVLIYQPHQNIRQHEVKDQYTDCFEQAEKIYWLPTYLSREDPNLPILTPEKLTQSISNQDAVHIVELNDTLWDTIQKARDKGQLVLLMGAGTIDGWARDELRVPTGAAIIPITSDDTLIVQHRDDKPDIVKPNMLGFFGGATEPEDTSLRETAVRELREETNFLFNPEDLVYFETSRDTDDHKDTVCYATYYVLPNVSVDGLEIYEGQGYKAIPRDMPLDSLPLTASTRRIITKYRNTR